MLALSSYMQSQFSQSDIASRRSADDLPSPQIGASEGSQEFVDVELGEVSNQENRHVSSLRSASDAQISQRTAQQVVAEKSQAATDRAQDHTLLFLVPLVTKTLNSLVGPAIVHGARGDMDLNYGNSHSDQFFSGIVGSTVFSATGYVAGRIAYASGASEEFERATDMAAGFMALSPAAPLVGQALLQAATSDFISSSYLDNFLCDLSGTAALAAFSAAVLCAPRLSVAQVIGNRHS